jgi:pimeloyl-ACP methyl ester carboxylesterase
MADPRAIDVDIGPGLRLWDHGGDGPVVLLLHGYLDTGRSYDAIADALAGDARCVALDWRGHGFSGRAGGGGSYHLLDHLKDLSRVVDALASGAIDVGAPDAIVAHSMGGNVALLLAGSRPAVVPRLLLLDALGPPAEPLEAQPKRLGRLLDGLAPRRPFKVFATRDEARERVKATNPGLSDEAAARMVAHALIEVDGGVTFNFDPELRGPVPMRYPESYWMAICAQVTCPTVVIRAAFGYVPEGAPATDRVATMQQGRLETLADVGHHLHVEQPELMADKVRALLTRPAELP